MDTEKLMEMAGVDFVHRNRSEPASNEMLYGGVAILWRQSLFNFKEVNVSNPDGFEMLVDTRGRS